MSILRRIILSALLVPAFAGAAWAVDSSTLYIKVRSSKLRKAPSYIGASLGTVAYGDGVTQLSTEGSWVRVKTRAGTIGYLHNSALSSRQVVLKSSKAGISGSFDSSEVILAGKGFSREIENNYARGNPSMNYNGVDEMERLRVSDGDLASFVKSGGLRKNA